MEEKRYNGVEYEPTMAAEPVLVSSVTPFDTVIRYLHSNNLNIDIKRAVYRQLQLEVADENLGNMKRRIKEIENLQYGWDGENAMPVNRDTIEMIRQVLKKARPSDLSDWSVSPNVNGTILLELDDAAISIASKEFSYYAERGERYMESEHQKCSVDALIETIRRINTFMQE
jgi:hypothetical protein